MKTNNIFAFFANEATPEAPATFANEFKQTDGWVELAPYGDWPNSGGLQRFTREDAETIVNEFKTLRNLPQRMLGLPWYIGHPDHARFADKYKDQRAYGRIKDLEVRDQGLFANVKWSEAGRALLESEAFHGHSVNWRVKKEGAVWRPVSLKSVGFTNDPQIPVAPAMANETQPNEPMPPWIKSSLVAAGLLSADATDEQVKAAFESLAKGAASHQSQLANEQQARTAAETALAEHTKAAAEKAQADKAAADTLLANERKAHAKTLLDVAEKEGRLKPAERATLETEFANEFDATAAKLAGLKPAIKTTPVADALRLRDQTRKASAARSEQVKELVNERITKHGETYDVAFMAVRKAKPELFEVTKKEAAAS